MKSKRGWILRVLGTALVLGVTLWLLPMREVETTIRNVRLDLWLVVFSIFLAGHLVGAAKWWIVTSRGDLPFLMAVKAHFAGLIANLCLPGAASGDIVRATFVMRAAQDKSRIAVGSIVDRLLDSFGLFALSCAGALFAIDRKTWLDGPLVKIGIVFLLALISVPLLSLVAARLPRTAFVEKLISALARLRNEPGKLALCLALSLLVQSAFIGSNIAFARASGIDVPVAVWFFAWPLAKLIAMLPISIGGLGVREASLAALLAPFGAVPAKVVGVSLLWQTILIASGLLGGLTLFISGKFPRENRDLKHSTL